MGPVSHRHPTRAVAILHRFTECLQVSRLFDPWVNSCPLVLTSPNAPSTRAVLVTTVLSILSGYQRYAHISALRGDTINPALLGMSEVVSEDSLRRNFGKIDEAEGVQCSGYSITSIKYLNGEICETLCRKNLIRKFNSKLRSERIYYSIGCASYTCLI